MKCQVFYRTEQGEEVQCSKDGFVRRIGDIRIALCPDHLDLFAAQMYPLPKLNLNAENTRRLFWAIFGRPGDYGGYHIRERIAGGGFGYCTRGWAVRHVIRELDRREQAILIRRLGLDGYTCRTLEQVGAVMGLTRERVRQIEAKALRRLRHPSRSKLLKQFIVEELRTEKGGGSDVEKV